MIGVGPEEKHSWTPKTEEEKEEVRRQMHRLLNTAHFKNSRRYPALFRFIVEETLEGRGEFLKERLLGIRVFNRAPDYDTASDPIVRVTIAEIRKRIAQYYHEESHELEMRIELMPGRYEPEFYPGRAPSTPAGVAAGSPITSPTFRPHMAEPEPAGSDPPSPQPDSQGAGRAMRRRSTRWWSAATAALVGLAIACTMGWRWAHPVALEQLWRPVLASQKTVTFCLPSASAGAQTAAAAGILVSDHARAKQPLPAASSPDGTFLYHENQGENVVFSDVLATESISRLVISSNREVRLRLSVATTLGDLQQGPTILIGGLDNGWTLRTVSRLRYRFAGNDREQYWIADTKNPDRRDWGVDLNSQYPAVKHDFALIARVHDESTGQVQVVVAGIGMSGTASAGEFLVNPAQIEHLREQVGPGFADHDFEAVLGMDVVNGIAGSPKILAVAVW